MQALRRGPFIGALALGLLYVPLLRLVSTREPAPAARPTPPARRSRPRTPFEAALREAAQDRTRAKIAVSRELEALETWDPEGMVPGSALTLIDVWLVPLRLPLRAVVLACPAVTMFGSSGGRSYAVDS